MNIPEKELHNLIDANHKCNDCQYFIDEVDYVFRKEAVMAKPGYRCKLTRTIMPNNYACGLYNKDISEEGVCYNCKHFLGSGDWGLSCGADYYTLTHALDEGCEKFYNIKADTFKNAVDKYFENGEIPKYDKTK